MKSKCWNIRTWTKRETSDYYDSEKTYKQVFFNHSNLDLNSLIQLIKKYTDEHGNIDHDMLYVNHIFVPQEKLIPFPGTDRTTYIDVFDYKVEKTNLKKASYSQYYRQHKIIEYTNITIPAPDKVYAVNKIYPKGSKFSSYYLNYESALEELTVIEKTEKDNSELSIEEIPWRQFKSLNKNLYDLTMLHSTVKDTPTVYFDKNNKCVGDSDNTMMIGLPLVRRRFPVLFGEDLVKVQTPTGLTNALRYINQSQNNYNPIYIPKKKKRRK